MTRPLGRYAPEELIRFLTALDRSLQKPAKLTVIGGSALALGYGGSAATSDIDTYESELDGVNEAATAARAETGLQIPISNSAIAQLPAGYGERLVRVLPGLTKLEVRVLDSHDLAASKLLRGNEHDRQQLAQLHALAPLDLDTLVARYRDLIADYVGDPTEPMLSLRHLVQELWGEIAAIDITSGFARSRRASLSPAPPGWCPRSWTGIDSSTTLTLRASHMIGCQGEISPVWHEECWRSESSDRGDAARDR